MLEVTTGSVLARNRLLSRSSDNSFWTLPCNTWCGTQAGGCRLAPYDIWSQNPLLLPVLTRPHMSVPHNSVVWLQKEHGWSDRALQAAAEQLQLSPAVTGMFERGPAELVEVWPSHACRLQ